MEESQGIKPPGHRDTMRFSVKANLFSGCAASMVSGLFFHPTDLIKIKMQQTIEKVRAWDIVRKVYSENGIRGFYKGTLLSFSMSGFIASFRMYLYSLMRYHAPNYSFLRNDSSRILIYSLVCSTLTSLLVTPIEHARIRMNSSEGNLYKGSFDAVKKMFKYYGFKVTHRCYFLTVVRESIYFVVFFSVFESIRRWTAGGDWMLLGKSLASMVAGPCAWLFIFPLDTVKTVIQSDSLSNPRWTAMKYFRHLWNQRVGFSMYNGVTSVMLRSFPLNFVFMTTWEQTLEFILRLEDKYAS